MPPTLTPSLSRWALVSTRAGEYVTMGCMNYIPKRLVRSLQDAYSILIRGFGKTGSSTAPGPGATVAGLKPASFAQKLWRFCVDPRVDKSALMETLQEAARQETARRPGVLLAFHDWWTLSFGGHPSKTDRAT